MSKLHDEILENPRMMVRRVDHVAGHPSAEQLDLPFLTLTLRAPQQERLRLGGGVPDQLLSSGQLWLAACAFAQALVGVLRHGTNLAHDDAEQNAPCTGATRESRVRGAFTANRRGPDRSRRRSSGCARRSCTA